MTWSLKQEIAVSQMQPYRRQSGLASRPTIDRRIITGSPSTTNVHRHSSEDARPPSSFSPHLCAQRCPPDRRFHPPPPRQRREAQLGLLPTQPSSDKSSSA